MQKIDSSDIFWGPTSLENLTDLERQKVELLRDWFIQGSILYRTTLEEAEKQVEKDPNYLNGKGEFRFLPYEGPHFSDPKIVSIVEIWKKPIQKSELEHLTIETTVSRIIDLSSAASTLMESNSWRKYQIFYEREIGNWGSIKAISIEWEIFFLEKIAPLLDGWSVRREYVHSTNPLIKLTLHTQVDVNYRKECRTAVFHKPRVNISRGGNVMLRDDTFLEFLPEGL